ncbi:MAG TPA: aminotransferase class I/II-fold pyridoxal phosphate-dependent enzyme [Gemmatimonadales bacterium]|nr:aminotransferase class I/II-fold pyridoxal phosphate-dependent enzyme [Gemmatimonadales bacterium]
MIRFSARIDRLPGYPLAQIPAIKRRLLAAGVDVIDLGAGDADYPPPAEVTEALQRAVEVPALNKYGFQQGLPAFRQATVNWMQRRFGITFDPVAEVLPLIGSKEGLSHLPLALLDPGDVAIVPEPGYQAYIGGTLLAGGEPHIYPLTPRTNFLLELDEVPPETLARTKLLFLNYPNNPTAAIAPREYLERTVALCRKHDIVLAYDNPYCDLTFDGYRAPSIFEIEGARDVAVEFFSVSKSFSMTGWRLGWAAGAARFITALTRVKSYVDTGPFLAIQQAAITALDNAERLIPPVVEELTRRRDAAVAALREEGFALETPKGAMYLWIALPEGLASADFTRHALEQHGVVLLPGSGFGPGGEGFFRIALTVPPSRLVEAVRRLGVALGELRGRVGAEAR